MSAWGRAGVTRGGHSLGSLAGVTREGHLRGSLAGEVATRITNIICEHGVYVVEVMRSNLDE